MDCWHLCSRVCRERKKSQSPGKAACLEKGADAGAEPFPSPLIGSSCHTSTPGCNGDLESQSFSGQPGVWEEQTLKGYVWHDHFKQHQWFSYWNSSAQFYTVFFSLGSKALVYSKESQVHDNTEESILVRVDGQTARYPRKHFIWTAMGRVNFVRLV